MFELRKQQFDTVLKTFSRLSPTWLDLREKADQADELEAMHDAIDRFLEAMASM